MKIPAQKSDLRAGDIIIEINGQIGERKILLRCQHHIERAIRNHHFIKDQTSGEEAPIEKTVTREIIK